MKSRINRICTLALLALMVPVAWASADRKVVVGQTENGTVTPDQTTAEAGATVTLTVAADAGYELNVLSLTVERLGDAGSADVVKAKRRAPGVGGFLTTKQTGEQTYSFEMPDADVLVSAAFVTERERVTIDGLTTSGDQTVTGITASIVPGDDDGEATIERINVPVDLQDTDITIYIPATVTDQNGNTLQVTTLATGALTGYSHVTDIYLPDTEEPLTIEDGALLLDYNTGSDHQVARIHTPLALLADYALMPALQENYEGGKVQATATAVHSYWTFSCGVDVEVPEGIRFYTCRQDNSGSVTLMKQYASTIKANNGVIMECASDEGGSYEMVAKPSAALPTGTPVSTENARSYDGNLLEPVIRGTHYDAGGYYIMYNNEFYAILQEGAEVRLPACKAVLHLSEQAASKRKITLND